MAEPVRPAFVFGLLRPSHHEAALTRAARQAALVRSLADELQRLAPSDAAGWLDRGQLAEELTRLGCRILEAAAALAREQEKGASFD